ncbi:MAG: hypothetical protein V4726_10505 [Verrucomicrobiota bacterium]
MNPRASLLLLLCLPAVIQAGTSAHYSLSPAAVDTGGGPGVSASGSMDFSGAPGGAGRSAAYVSRSGFAGQLDETAGLEILISPASVAETGSAQLEAGLRSRAGFLAALAPDGVAWSILDGPLTGITPGGLVTAGKTPQTTAATVQGVFSGFTGTLTFPVRDTIPDNFGVHAGDGLPDWWQRQYPDAADTAGGLTGDPDRDGLSNLLEFAFGTDPGHTGSGVIAYSDGVLTSHGQPLPVITTIPNSVDLRIVFGRRRDSASIGLSYKVQFSADLAGWTTSTALPVVLAGDAEYEAVGVSWPFFLNGRKVRFFRMMIDYTPAP